jgi:hypothetical protein
MQKDPAGQNLMISTVFLSIFVLSQCGHLFFTSEFEVCEV